MARVDLPLFLQRCGNTRSTNFLWERKYGYELTHESRHEVNNKTNSIGCILEWFPKALDTAPKNSTNFLRGNFWRLRLKKFTEKKRAWSEALQPYRNLNFPSIFLIYILLLVCHHPILAILILRHYSMKLKNDFSAKTRQLFADGFCFICSTSVTLELHHICGRVSDSPMNGALLCREHHSHMGHNMAEEGSLLLSTARFLLHRHYVPTDEDLRFLGQYWGRGDY